MNILVAILFSCFFELATRVTVGVGVGVDMVEMDNETSVTNTGGLEESGQVEVRFRTWNEYAL